MKYIIKRTENFEGTITNRYLDNNGWYSLSNPNDNGVENQGIRYFDTEEEARERIEEEKSDPLYDRKWMGDCTFEVEAI